MNRSDEDTKVAFLDSPTLRLAASYPNAHTQKMPRISVWLVRCALAHLAGGFTLGALVLTGKGRMVAESMNALRPLHAEMLLFGWTVQLAFGVGAWILPFGRGVDDDRRLHATLVLINAGVVLVGLSVLDPGSAWLTAAGRITEIGAAGLFAWHIWPRVRQLPKRAEH